MASKKASGPSHRRRDEETGQPKSLKRQKTKTKPERRKVQDVKASQTAPHRLQQLVAAPTIAPVYICKDTADADRIGQLGFIATCVSEGVDLKAYFRDRHVCILEQPRSRNIAAALDGVAASVRVFDLGVDVPSWIKNDRAGAKLAKLAKVVPLWEPVADRGVDESPDPDVGVGATAAVELMVKKQADALIQLAEDADLFHTPAGDAYADVMVDHHRETYRVRSKAFRSWLSFRFFEAREGAPSSEAMSAALGVIEARALFSGPEHTVNVRVAAHDCKFYLDLADAEWRAVEIDANGWRVISSPPVHFRRAPGMLPLPEPVSGGSIDALRSLVNVRDEDFVLVVAYLLAALRPHGPFPVLALAGEHGTTKSTLTRLVRALIDPNALPLRALPREDRDLFISASNAHLLTFDNVSGLPAWISDTLCRLATGGGFATRQLYTDDAEMLFDAMRPIVLNGITDVATRPDLVDRSIMLTLEIMDAEKVQTEAEYWEKFNNVRPALLGALLDTTAHGLSRLDQVKLKRLPRMADFFKWVTACETALWPEGTFAAAYEANSAAAVTTTIDADLVAGAVVALMADRNTWTGTATNLLATLTPLVPLEALRTKDWPKSPNHLSGHLRRVAPLLRKVGIKIDKDRDGNKRDRLILISRGQPESGGKPSSGSSGSSAASKINGLVRTIREDVASAPSSAKPGRDGADDHADDADERTARTNPLQAHGKDDADDQDDHLHTLSGGVGADDRSCRQCGGVIDGSERPYQIDG